MVMRTKHRRISNRGRWVVPCLAAAFLSYFGFHAINGELGLNSKMQLDLRRERLTKELAGLVEQRKELERRTALLQDGTIEKDMLDEQARSLLEVARPDEIVIYRRP